MFLSKQFILRDIQKVRVVSSLKAEKVIFSGDTVFKGAAGRCDLYGGSWDLLVDSIQKLSSLKVDYQIFPGHGEDTTLNVEKAENLYFQSIQ